MSSGNLIQGLSQGDGGTAGDFFAEVGKGNIEGVSSFILGAKNPSIGALEETIWPLGGVYPYITTPVELFLTSSNVGDVGQSIVVTGIRTLDGVLERPIYQTNGRTPVSTGTWYRIFSLRNFGDGSAGNLLGSLYLAETDTLILGVPQTATKIKGGIIFDSIVNRSPNSWVFPGITPPKGTFVLIIGLDVAAPKGLDVRVSSLVRRNIGSIITPFQDDTPFNFYQAVSNFKFAGFRVNEGWDLEFRAVSAGAAVEVTILSHILLFDANLHG